MCRRCGSFLVFTEVLLNLLHYLLPRSVCGFTGLSILVLVASLEAKGSSCRNNLTPSSTVPPSAFEKVSLKAYQSVLNRLPQ